MTMKLLVFLAESFDYRASEAGSALAPETPEPSEDRVENAIVAFIQCEPRDEERGEAVLKQAVKYFRWFARKRGVTRLVLHYAEGAAGLEHRQEGVAAVLAEHHQHVKLVRLDLVYLAIGHHHVGGGNGATDVPSALTHPADRNPRHGGADQ